MTYVPTKEVKIKERQDKFLKAQLEKEREQALLEEIEKTEKERVKKKGKDSGSICAINHKSHSTNHINNNNSVLTEVILFIDVQV